MLQGLDTLLSIILWASYNQLRLFKPPALRCAGVVPLNCSSGGSRTLGEQTPARACSAPVFSMTLDCSPLSISETRPARSYLRHHNIATRLGSSLISATFPFTAHSLRGIARCLRTSLLWVLKNISKNYMFAVTCRLVCYSVS